MMTGLFAAFALLSGIIAARATGSGRDIDVSLFDCALQNLNYLATWYLNEGHKQGREPRSSHPSLTPSQLYRTRDGYIFIMCNKEKFWPVFCDMIGRPDLAADSHFRSFKDRLANREKLTVLLDEALSGRTTAEWLEHFAGRVPAAPVNDVASALDNPFVREGGRIWSIDHPERADFKMVAAPYGCPGEKLPQNPAPALGQDTERLLTECGLSREQVATLRERGVI
jgi:succinate---hydroxymethylglutarate CoA-transferase